MYLNEVKPNMPKPTVTPRRAQKEVWNDKKDEIINRIIIYERAQEGPLWEEQLQRLIKSNNSKKLLQRIQ